MTRRSILIILIIMAPRGVCAHLPCVGGEFSSRASSECSSDEPVEWEARRRYRQLVRHQRQPGGGGGGHYRQLVDQKGFGYYRHPPELDSGVYRQLKEKHRLVDCSNEHILLPTDTYPENDDILEEEEEEKEQSLEIAERFLVDSSNLYAKVRPKNRRTKLQLLEISDSPRHFQTSSSNDQPVSQKQEWASKMTKTQPQNIPLRKNMPTTLTSMPEPDSLPPPAITAIDLRVAQLRKEMSASTSPKENKQPDKDVPKKGGQGKEPLPRLPPVCGRSPPCHCPEDRELAAKLRLRIIKKISTLRRKHLRLRVTLSFSISPV